MSLIPSPDRCVSEDEITSYIPEDLMIDILLRVPTRSICVFRGLSKYYRELIDSGEFTRNHYEASMKTRSSILLIRKRGCDIPVVIQLDFESGCKFVEFIPPFWDIDGGRDISFLGCHRGIVCCKVGREPFAEVMSQLVFWNPITGAVRSHFDTIQDHRIVRYFSGYDSVTDDIKVLKIVSVPLGFMDYRTVSLCEVYSSKTDSWKRTGGFDHIKDDDGNMLSLEGRTRVFVENCVHMFARFDCRSGGRQVLAYDFMSEEFKLVPLPKSCAGSSYQLSSVDGCLLLLSEPSRDHKVEGWIMKEYGIHESWAILFSIDLTHHFGINASPHLLIQSYNPHTRGMELYIYDVNRKQFSNIAPSDLDRVHRRQLSNIVSPLPKHLPFVPSHRQP